MRGNTSGSCPPTQRLPKREFQAGSPDCKPHLLSENGPQCSLQLLHGGPHFPRLAGHLEALGGLEAKQRVAPRERGGVGAHAPYRRLRGTQSGTCEVGQACMQGGRHASLPPHGIWLTLPHRGALALELQVGARCVHCLEHRPPLSSAQRAERAPRFLNKPGPAERWDGGREVKPAGPGLGCRSRHSVVGSTMHNTVG